MAKKQLLINEMHVVYEGAYLTVVAAGGGNADARLHGLQEGTRSREETWTIPTQQGNFTLAIAKPKLEDLLSSDALDHEDLDISRTNFVVALFILYVRRGFLFL